MIKRPCFQLFSTKTALKLGFRYILSTYLFMDGNCPLEIILDALFFREIDAQKSENLRGDLFILTLLLSVCTILTDSQWVSQWVSQSVSQPVSQPASQPVSQLINKIILLYYSPTQHLSFFNNLLPLFSQSVSQTVSQSVRPSVRQSVRPSVRQSVSQSDRQSDNQLDSQSVSQSDSQGVVLGVAVVIA